MISIRDLRTEIEWTEYCRMPQVRTNETPGEWKERIWERLMYFRENGLLPSQSKKYIEARKLIRFPDGSSYAPAIGIAICFSCDRLVYTGQRKKNIGNYNHIGMEKHWKISCTGNKYCKLKYEDYLKIKHKPSSDRTFNDTRALHYYELWMSNAISKLKRAREVGKKMRACILIQRKWIEFMYHPNSLIVKQLAEHYTLLWSVREDIRHQRSQILLLGRMAE
ncbi:1987_t:CDS:1 [Paraglomus occultum]|uniref:1987_t:CDS:1 n=1 Tax=Paraglomus occultum TaxID=144539 RepID=A0A9N9DVC3_9GLOM|nr:1987_t:CDS:1 [Paraglomus occultum]